MIRHETLEGNRARRRLGAVGQRFRWHGGGDISQNGIPSFGSSNWNASNPILKRYAGASSRVLRACSIYHESNGQSEHSQGIKHI